ncbi:hypothetical protein [Methylosinus sp. Ce-a6]|uniref:hypothetical protein n=1 Tax=Methylosinus sp. Ce-a6 TaxID=2172005 RepID=UPI00135B2895|nr:hypothetical protein [Methylosinus sp. Ce-a6]
MARPSWRAKVALAEPTILRTALARLALRGARLFAGLAEWIAPWIRQDYVEPPERRPSTWTLAAALVRLKVARWRLALGRMTS